MEGLTKQEEIRPQTGKGDQETSKEKNGAAEIAVSKMFQSVGIEALGRIKGNPHFETPRN